MSSQRAGSTTCVIELNDTPYARDRYPTGSKTPYQLPDTIRAATPPAPQDEENRSTTSNSDNADPPASATAALQTWNNPPVNKWRILAAFFSFIVLGMNDAAPGALIPYLEKYYDLNFTVVSLIFLSPFVGYVSAAIVNNWIHTQLGRRGVGIVASGAHCLAYVVMSLHPPYPWLVVVMCLAGFGSGIMDAAWNS